MKLLEVTNTVAGLIVADLGDGTKTPALAELNTTDVLLLSPANIIAVSSLKAVTDLGAQTVITTEAGQFFLVKETVGTIVEKLAAL